MSRERKDDAPKRLIDMNDRELLDVFEQKAEAVATRVVEAVREPRIMLLVDVAKMLRVHEKTVKKLIKTEGLPTLRKIGRELRFERDAVVEWMRQQDTTPRKLSA